MFGGECQRQRAFRMLYAFWKEKNGMKSVQSGEGKECGQDESHR